MGSALYVELKETPSGLDTFMNGKPLAKSWDALDLIGEQIGIATMTKICIPNWRLPDKWITVFVAYLEHIRAHPSSVPDPEGVIVDLEDVVRLLKEAQRAGTKWRLVVDY